MDKPLISVIVPVYNADKTLKKTMQCILNQTYEPLEIILVDDDSRDTSWKLCRWYECKHSNVSSYHKKNGGAASARNYGVAKSSGEYLCFIDADDLVTADYIEFLYKMIVECGVDISICGYQKFFDANNIKKISEDCKTEVMGKQEAISCILYRKKLSSSPCFKLMKREVFMRNPFPEGMLFEDLAVVYKWFDSVDSIAYNSSKKYYYLQHEGSSMHSDFNPKKWDLIIISKEILKFINKNYPNLRKGAEARLFVSAIQMMRDIPMERAYHNQRKELKKYICRYRKSVFRDASCTMTTRILALLSFLSIYIIKYAAILYKQSIMILKIKISY